MNRMESYSGASPSGSTETICKVTIDTAPATLSLADCIMDNGRYTFQCFIKSAAQAGFTIQGESFTSYAQWSKCIKTFDAERYDSVLLSFSTSGTYYIYHAKLETGEIATEWTDNTFDALSKRIVFGELNDDMIVSVDSVSDDVGFVYEIHCTGEVLNPFIHHEETDQYFRLTKQFKLDDVITIDTRRGKKSVKVTYRGVTTNIINYVDNTSKWLQLISGYNHITQGAEEGAENMTSTLNYTNEYGGV